MAKWKVFDGDTTPSCTNCGIGAPFARYKRKQGINAREITDYCPNCGSKMTAIDECECCKYSHCGNWKNDGICISCRADAWVYGKKQNEKVTADDFMCELYKKRADKHFKEDKHEKSKQTFQA